MCLAFSYQVFTAVLIQSYIKPLWGKTLLGLSFCQGNTLNDYVISNHVYQVSWMLLCTNTERALGAPLSRRLQSKSYTEQL